MTIVNNILKQMPAVGQPQRKFLVLLVQHHPRAAGPRQLSQSEPLL